MRFLNDNECGARQILRQCRDPSFASLFQDDTFRFSNHTFAAVRQDDTFQVINHVFAALLQDARSALSINM